MYKPYFCFFFLLKSTTSMRGFQQKKKERNILPTPSVYANLSKQRRRETTNPPAGEKSTAAAHQPEVNPSTPQAINATRNRESTHGGIFD